MNTQTSKTYWQRAVFLGLILFLVIFRIHNALTFNPYWGYDGGGHIQYIFSIVEGHGFPKISENYLAWHEPLYYLLQAGFLKIFFRFTTDVTTLLNGLNVIQALLSLGVAYVSYKVIAKLSEDFFVRFAAFAIFNLLPAMTLISMYLTNELLNYFFILLLLLLFSNDLKETASWRGHVTMGIIAGLALLTKITAIIPIGLWVVYRLGRFMRTRERKVLTGMVVVVLLAILIDFPWQVYRATRVLAHFSINNYEYLQPAPLYPDSRILFFLRTDADVFKFPYWYSGGRSFWTMLEADLFYDYYGLAENRDALNVLPISEKVRTTVSGTYVSRKHFELSRRLIWLAQPLALVVVVGFWQMLVRAWRKQSSSGRIIGTPEAFQATFFVAMLGALIYLAYRYPYYDRGIVKAVFIYPAFIYPITVGLDTISRWPRDRARVGFMLFGVVIIAYVILLIQALWIPKFNQYVLRSGACLAKARRCL